MENSFFDVTNRLYSFDSTCGSNLKIWNALRVFNVNISQLTQYVSNNKINDGLKSFIYLAGHEIFSLILIVKRKFLYCHVEKTQTHKSKNAHSERISAHWENLIDNPLMIRGRFAIFVQKAGGWSLIMMGQLCPKPAWLPVKN